MLIGYARVSTDDQNLDLQRDALRLAGCEKIYEDRMSGAKAARPGLTMALEVARTGDVLTVWRLDRLWSPLLAVMLFTPSAFLLGRAEKQLPAATVYATFTGIATAATTIIGTAFFGESMNPGRLCSLVLIVMGLIGLKLFSGPTG
jgi:multidrug transporter EmrE-like cation transporter